MSAAGLVYTSSLAVALRIKPQPCTLPGEHWRRWHRHGLEHDTRAQAREVREDRTHPEPRDGVPR